MKLFSSKLTIVFIVIMSVLCMAALFISVRISITMIKKHNQIAKSIPVENKIVHDTGKYISSSKIAEQEFYFNGEKINGINSYLAEKKEFFVPIDAVLNRLGINFNFYSPDDILEAGVNGKKLMIKLGEGNFSLGGKGITLPSAPVTAKDHILVPEKLFSYMEGFKTDGYPDKNALFINYYSGFKPEEDMGIKVLRLINGMGTISGIGGEKIFWRWKDGFSGKDMYVPSFDGSSSMLKSDQNEKVYLVKSGSDKAPYSVKIGSAATWSLDGRYLYWVDEGKKTSYIYDIKSGIMRELGDYSFRIKNDEEHGYLLYGGSVLYDYKEGSGYKRVALTNVNNDSPYTFIERNGRVIIEGNVAYSPDKKKILFRNSVGYYTANSDGTGIVFIDSAREARWVNNNKIFARTDNELLIYSKDGKNKTRIDSEWRMAGQTLNGDVFFTKGNSLYIETNGSEKKIADLPWECDYACGQSASGPYVVVSSGKEDGVFYFTRTSIVRVGKYSSLLMSMKEGEIYTDYKRNIVFSPDSRNIAVFQRENGFIVLNIVIADGTVQKKVVLNHAANDAPGIDDINMKWVSGSRIMAYTRQHGWIVDFKSDVKIYDWSEQEGSTIEGVIY